MFLDRPHTGHTVPTLHLHGIVKGCFFTSVRVRYARYRIEIGNKRYSGVQLVAYHESPWLWLTRPRLIAWVRDNCIARVAI